jgi:hypothetical protein
MHVMGNRWGWGSVGGVEPEPPVPTTFDMFWDPPSLEPAHDRFGSQSNDVTLASSFHAGSDMNALSEALDPTDVLRISRASNPALFLEITVSDPSEEKDGGAWFQIFAAKSGGSFTPNNGEAVKVELA